MPAGTSATVYVPATAEQSFVAPRPATPTGRVDGYQVFAVEPGEHVPAGHGAPRRRRHRAGDVVALAAAPATFGAFTPGVAKVHGVHDRERHFDRGRRDAVGQRPSSTAPGRLVNGAYSLAQPLRVRAANTAFAALGGTPLRLLTWNGPVSKDAVTLAFEQAIGPDEPLRTGSYGKTLTYTLSTTMP